VLLGRQRDELLFGEPSPGSAVRIELLDDAIVGREQLVVLNEQLTDRRVVMDEVTDVRLGEPRMLLRRFGEVTPRILGEHWILHRKNRQVELSQSLHRNLYRSLKPAVITAGHTDA